jgi:hypothetical protein
MATHVMKSVTVDAVQFTAELGKELQDEAAKAEAESREPKAHKSGITFEVGKGYRLNGQTVAFGDYLVTSNGVTTVMTKQAFEDTYAPKGGK